MTDQDLPDWQVWRRYHGRAGCEDLIKELKCDLAANSFCMHTHYANEACLSAVMFAYNLMCLFRRAAFQLVRFGQTNQLLNLHIYSGMPPSTAMIFPVIKLA